MKRQSPTAGFPLTSSNAAMKDPSVEASMLIRRPPGEVFAAFVNPHTLRKFWLSDASGPLAPGARVKWQFMVPGATANVVVTRFEAPHHLAFDWADDDARRHEFRAVRDGGTQPPCAVSGFDGADALAQATGTIEGFSIVLCDLKTLLETGNSANLVRDKAALIVRRRHGERRTIGGLDAIQWAAARPAALDGSTRAALYKVPPMPLPQFHPAVQAWFAETFPDGATPAQLDAWPAIASGGHALIAAPTGSGKTLAAFLAAIDSLVREGAAGRLQDVTRVVYVSPLKALSNDIQRNLEAPLAGISAELITLGLHAPEIRAQVRTGDTSQTERAAMRRHAAAHPRDDAGVALSTAHQRLGPRDAARPCAR